MTLTTKSPAETKKFGQELARKLRSGGVVCLFGELGAGKTTLIQGIAKGLGIKQRIISPTFIIARKYDNFWHIDLYRLKSLAEVQAVGIEEILSDPKSIVVIEWPEKILKILPKHYYEVRIKILNETEREISEAIH